MTDLPPPSVARFEFTIDDLVDLGERTLSRSRVVGDLRRNATVGAAVIVAALVFLAVPGTLALRLGVAALFGFLLQLRARRRQKRGQDGIELGGFLDHGRVPAARYFMQ